MDMAAGEEGDGVAAAGAGEEGEAVAAAAGAGEEGEAVVVAVVAGAGEVAAGEEGDAVAAGETEAICLGIGSKLDQLNIYESLHVHMYRVVEKYE